MDKIICQVWLVFFGSLAVWLVGRREPWARWGYIFGLVSQPAWIYAAWTGGQWGILLMAVFYTYAWGQGVYNFWILPAPGSGEN